jgi:hypothetical protein
MCVIYAEQDFNMNRQRGTHALSRGPGNRDKPSTLCASWMIGSAEASQWRGRQVVLVISASCEYDRHPVAMRAHHRLEFAR